MKTTARMIAIAGVATSLVFSSVANATAAAQAPQQPGAWMALSMLTPASAATLGTAGAAVQSSPYYAQRDRNGLSNGPIPLPVMLMFAAVFALDIYLLTTDRHRHAVLVPNSPG